MALKRKLAFFIATLLFLTTGYVTVRTLGSSARRADEIAREQASYGALRQLLSAMKDAETGQRGYLVTNNPIFLEPYQAGLADARRALTATRKAFGDAYPATVAGLVETVTGELAFLGESVRLTRDGLTAAAVERAPQGKATMDQIRALIGGLSGKEAAVLQQQREDLRQNISRAIVTVCASLFLALLLSGLASAGMLSDLRARELAEKALWREQEGLEERVRRRTQELEDSNQKLLETNRALAEESERRSSLQEQLWASNERFQTAFEHAAIGMGQADAEGRFVLVNRQLCEITGYSEGELLSKTFQDITHPDDAPENLDYSQQLWAQKITPHSRRKRYMRRDGRPVWVAVTVAVIRDEMGQPKHYIGAVQDIGPEREAEQKLIDSETRYRFLADSMPQIVWTARGDGWIDYYNQRWFDYTGKTAAQTQGSGWDSVLHPADRDNIREAWAHAVATGRPYESEYRIQRKSDGEYRWHLGRALPLKDAEGQVVRWFGTSTDIDDYKRVETEFRELNGNLEVRVSERTSDLAETEQRFRSLVEGVKDYAIVMLDPQGRVRSWTAGAQQMKGYTAEEILGEHFSCFYTKEDREAANPQRSLRVALETGQFTEEGWRVCKNGSRFWASVLITTLRNENGTVRGFSKITRDVSTRKRAEELLQKKTGELEAANVDLAALTLRAEQASEAKSNFLASMSHEIRTPMNAILGMADLLWESDLDLEQRRYVEVFRRAGGNLLTLINDILDLSKIESGNFELEEIEFDLADVFDRTMELIEPKARAKGLELLSRFSSDLHTSLMGDPARLQQILINLLGNAVKFTEAGQIVLTAKPDGTIAGGVSISVADTGLGIPKDKLRHIFDDFTQADASITRKFGGTGLGLGISKRLVTLMGGELEVRSNVGCGSIFSFVAKFTNAPQASRAKPKSLEDFHGRRVLVIDDDATNRLIIRQTLSSWGLETRECEGAAEGMAEVEAAMRRSNPYALILLDSEMPKVSGSEAVAALRKVTPEIPIIVLTSNSQPGDPTRLRQYNVTGYTEKPVQRAELLRLICLALGTSDAKRAPEREAGQGRAEADTKRMRLLAAEDSPDNRVLVEAYLKGGPYDLTFVENGQLAVERFRERDYDLVLMDIQMPVMDGLTAARLMRQFEREQGGKATPIIALTANALRRDVDAVLEAGCDAHLAKPISKQKLISILENRRAALESIQADKGDDFDVPEGLEEQAKGYIECRKIEVPVLRDLRTGLDYPQLRALAHNMKGTGTSFGFPELTRLGGALESSAEQQDGTTIDRQLMELSRYLDRAAEFVGTAAVATASSQREG